MPGRARDTHRPKSEWSRGGTGSSGIPGSSIGGGSGAGRDSSMGSSGTGMSSPSAPGSGASGSPSTGGVSGSAGSVTGSGTYGGADQMKLDRAVQAYRDCLQQ